MQSKLFSAAVAAVCLAGCGQSADRNVANQAAAAAPKVQHPTYCFFADANTKGWAAKRDSSGNVTVAGKAYLEDARYQAQLIQPEVKGAAASIWLTMGPNAGPYAAPQNWWNVSASIPGSSGAATVTVMCAANKVTTLTVPATK